MNWSQRWKKIAFDNCSVWKKGYITFLNVLAFKHKTGPKHSKEQPSTPGACEAVSFSTPKIVSTWSATLTAWKDALENQIDFALAQGAVRRMVCPSHKEYVGWVDRNTSNYMCKVCIHVLWNEVLGWLQLMFLPEVTRRDWQKINMDLVRWKGYIYIYI